MASTDVADEAIASELIATVLDGDETSPNASSTADSSLEVLKMALVGANISADDAENLIRRCLDGVRAASQKAGASRLSNDNTWYVSLAPLTCVVTYVLTSPLQAKLGQKGRR